jgi:hypothetical protein
MALQNKVLRKVLWNYTEATERNSIDGEDEGVQGFAFSVYCFIPFQRLLPFVGQPKARVASGG